jgi:type IV secretory pathway VirB10-like protein
VEVKFGKIDRYFLTQDAPLGKIRRFDLTKIKGLLIALGGAALLLILLIPPDDKKNTKTANSISDATSITANNTRLNATAAGSGEFYVSNMASFGSSEGLASRSNRELSASQVVKQQGGGLGFGLPSGTAIAVRLLNRIVTSDSRNPVIAVVTAEATSPSGFTLVIGTKVLGSAQAEPGSDRVQVNFHTLVFENGAEQAFNAIATMPDGSSGIAGNYHSQIVKKEGGRFLSRFIGGFADGFKDREKGNIGSFEPGNLKNAALNGVSESASEHAKTYETEMKNINPYVSVEPGTPFMLFLEKGIAL